MTFYLQESKHYRDGRTSQIEWVILAKNLIEAKKAATRAHTFAGSLLLLACDKKMEKVISFKAYGKWRDIPQEGPV